MGDHVGYRNPTQLSDGQSTIQSSYAEIDPRQYSASSPLVNHSDGHVAVADHQPHFIAIQQQQQQSRQPTPRPKPRPRKDLPQNAHVNERETVAGVQNQRNLPHPQPQLDVRQAQIPTPQNNFPESRNVVSQPHSSHHLQHQVQPGMSGYLPPDQLQRHMQPNVYSSGESPFSSIGTLYDSMNPHNPSRGSYDSMYSPVQLKQIIEMGFDNPMQSPPNHIEMINKPFNSPRYPPHEGMQPNRLVRNPYFPTEHLYDRRQIQKMDMQPKPYGRPQNEDIYMHPKSNVPAGSASTIHMYDGQQTPEMDMQPKSSMYIPTEGIYDKPRNESIYMHPKAQAAAYMHAKLNASAGLIPSMHMYDALQNSQGQYPIHPNQRYSNNSLQSMHMYDQYQNMASKNPAGCPPVKPGDERNVYDVPLNVLGMAPIITPPRNSTYNPPSTPTSPHGNIPEEILLYRDQIDILIKENKSLEERRNVVMELLKSCPELRVNVKYTQLPFSTILKENENNNVQKLPMAFKVLEKYATNLLKHESERHSSWRKVSFLSSAFQQHVRPLRGNIKILKMIGYSKEVSNERGDIVAVSFEEDAKPNEKLVRRMATDLCIAKVEVEEIILRSHPQLQKLKELSGIPHVFFSQNSTTPEDQPQNTDTDRFVQQQQPETPVYAIPQKLPKPFVNQPTNNNNATTMPFYQNQRNDATPQAKSPEQGPMQAGIMVLYCTKCRSAREGEKFCSECGTKLEHRRTSSPMISPSQAISGIRQASAEQPYSNLEQPYSSSEQPYSSSELPQASSWIPQASYGLPQASYGLPPASSGLPQASPGSSQATYGLPQASPGPQAGPGRRQQQQGPKPQRKRIPSVYEAASAEEKPAYQNPAVNIYDVPPQTAANIYDVPPQNAANIYDVPPQMAVEQNNPNSNDLTRINLSNVNRVHDYKNTVADKKDGGQWQCQHCTFFNPSTTKVCGMCHKTSWQREDEKPPGNVSPSTVEPSAAPTDNDVANNVGVNNQAIGNVVEKPTTTKDDVDSKDSPNKTSKQKKKNADNQDGKQVVSAEDSNLRDFDIESYVLIESTQGKGKATSAPPDLSKFDEESAAFKKVTKELKHVSLDPCVEISKEQKEVIFSRLQTREAEKKAREEERKQKTLERRRTMDNERKLFEQNAKRLVELFKFAERNGFTVDECYIAITALREENKNIQPSQEKVQQWLAKNWISITNDTVKECNALYGGSNDNNNSEIGIISVEEAKQLLIKNYGDRKKVMEQFLQQRKDKIKAIKNKLSEVETTEIIKALNAASGDEEKAKDNLCKTMFADLLKRTKEPLDHKKFFEKLKDKKVAEETKCIMLLAEGFTNSWGYAQACCKLIDQVQDMGELDVHDFITAAESSHYFDQCLKFLKHTCGMCYGEYPVSKIVNSTQCECEYCFECFTNFLKTTISSSDISNLICAHCQKELVFGHLEQQIREFVKRGLMDEVHLQQFHTKLLDMASQGDPNFRYCGHCPSGFLWENPNLVKMTCNACRRHTCFKCKIKWPVEHEGLNCEEYEQWKYMNENPFNEKDIAGMFDRTELACPSPTCNFRFEMARGGCMHFTCSKCKTQFCSGCCREMVDANKGGRTELCNDSCLHKGLHAHHPRDCGSYLRDKDIDELQALLDLHQIPYETKLAEERRAEDPVLCIINEQREVQYTKDDGTEDTRLDDVHCGHECEADMAGVCKKHYKEYLILLINRYGIDPLDTMDIGMVGVLFKRHNLQLPAQNTDEADADYLTRARQVAKANIELPQRKKFPRPNELQQQAGAAAASYQQLNIDEEEEKEDDDDEDPIHDDLGPLIED